MTLEKLMDDAREVGERLARSQKESEERERAAYGEELASMLDSETWAALGVDPHEGKITVHKDVNIYLSLGRVYEVKGRLRFGDEQVGIVVRCPLATTAFRAMVVLTVAPSKGRYEATLWPVSKIPYHGDLGFEDHSEKQRSANILAIGRMLLEYRERDRGRQREVG